MKENRQDRFRRIAEARVNKIISMLKLLSNCSFQGNYQYTEEQVEKIFQTLQGELDKVKSRYVAALHGIGRFSLTENYYKDDSAYPSVILQLPDGTRLRASAVDDENFPAINIWLQTEGEEQSVAFVEYNSQRERGKELCIGVCNSASDDPYFYESFNKEQDN